MALPRQNFKKKSSNIRIDSSFSASDEVRLSYCVIKNFQLLLLKFEPRTKIATKSTNITIFMVRKSVLQYEGTCSLTSPAEARKAIARKLGQLKSFPTAITQFADLSNCTTALPSNHSTCQP
ncbi:unnamed protein product [Acanthoscelides obtectus]|uniref:Uncharacterized protein n=1 Tax=Acanthoscelides obtectus TaxID=200917 RepID=A0A9P0PVX4_ACAOB|nr:unnamed protein product [Acanthoscelides obtectus]CAK1649675.1 hypothetical protein AOBTE_LOCUS16354 [Acanthoscelides obtectus]